MARKIGSKCGGAAIWFWGTLLALVALWLRYRVIEAGVLASACSDGTSGGPACLARDLLVQGFQHQRVGWLSLAAGVASFLAGWRAVAWLAWLSGLVGLILYSYDPAAVGTLLGLIVLMRPHQEHRQGQCGAGQRPGDGLGVGRFR